jgi:hypothetical protein
MKWVGVAVLLSLSTFVASGSSSSGSSSSHVLTDHHPIGKDIVVVSRRYLTMYSRKIKTVTVERNVDDDYTDGSNNIDTATTKTKKVTRAHAIPKDISVSTTTKTTVSSTKSGKHHNMTKNTDDNIFIDDDDYDYNTTTPRSDLMDVVNRNTNSSMNSNEQNDGFVLKGGKIVLPHEHEPNETWVIAIVILFTSMAVSLCVTTAIHRCRKRNANTRRDGYEEIDNIVVV